MDFDDEDDLMSDVPRLWGKRKTRTREQREAWDKEQTKFWLKLGKDNAIVGNSKGTQNALGWAKKYGASVNELDEIRQLVTEEKDLEYRRELLASRKEDILSYAHVSRCYNIKWELRQAKEFAKSLNLEKEYEKDEAALHSHVSIIERHRANSVDPVVMWDHPEAFISAHDMKNNCHTKSILKRPVKNPND